MNRARNLVAVAVVLLVASGCSDFLQVETASGSLVTDPAVSVVPPDLSSVVATPAPTPTVVPEMADERGETQACDIVFSGTFRGDNFDSIIWSGSRLDVNSDDWSASTDAIGEADRLIARSERTGDVDYVFELRPDRGAGWTLVRVEGWSGFSAELPAISPTLPWWNNRRLARRRTEYIAETPFRRLGG